MASAPLFKPEEDAVISELFPDYAAIALKLPDRSRRAIKRRASKLGVSAFRSTKLRKWTEAEDGTIRKHYPDYAVLYALLASRTRLAIKRRAADLGVSAGHCGGIDASALPWSDQERELAAHWGAKIPGRSRFALVSFRRRNGIKINPGTAPRSKPKPQTTRRPGRPPKLKVQHRAAQVSPPKPRVIQLSAPKPVTWKRQGNEINPRIIAAAARSKHGIELIATVQRAVPREVWPHLRPLVIEQVALSVMEGRADLSDLPGAVKTTVAALVAQQFSGAA